MDSVPISSSKIQFLSLVSVDILTWVPDGHLTLALNVLSPNLVLFNFVCVNDLQSHYAGNTV